MIHIRELNSPVLYLLLCVSLSLHTQEDDGGGRGSWHKTVISVWLLLCIIFLFLCLIWAGDTTSASQRAGCSARAETIGPTPTGGVPRAGIEVLRLFAVDYKIVPPQLASSCAGRFLFNYHEWNGRYGGLWLGDLNVVGCTVPPADQGCCCWRNQQRSSYL